MVESVIVIFVLFFASCQALQFSIVQRENNAKSPLKATGLFGDNPSLVRRHDGLPNSVEWKVYVDQSKPSMDRGGGATLDAFCGLSPLSNIEIIPSILPRSSKKYPWIRCISTVPGRASLDIGNVDSVDKVYRILTKHLQIKNVSREACVCLKWKYHGNSQLEAGNVCEAIKSYDNAVATANGSNQQGVVQLLRATAYQQQAASHKSALQEALEEAKETQSQTPDFRALFSKSCASGLGRSTVKVAFLRKLSAKANLYQTFLQRIKYHHGLYRYALFHAAQDALLATKFLPEYPAAWFRAGEILREVWELQEAGAAYDKAASLDENVCRSMELIQEDLKTRQELLRQDRFSSDLPEDLLRVALDLTT